MNRYPHLTAVMEAGLPRVAGRSAAMRGMALACALGAAASMPAAQAQPETAVAALPAHVAAAASSQTSSAAATAPPSHAQTAPALTPIPASFQPPAKYPWLPAVTTAARLAANCAACHGTNGVTEGVALPSLAGQGKGALLVALKAFKSGARQGTIMPQIARGYTDEQLALLAEFFAAQPPVPVAALQPAQEKTASQPQPKEDRTAGERAVVSRIAVTGWPQERGSTTGSGAPQATLRIAATPQGSQP